MRSYLILVFSFSSLIATSRAHAVSCLKVLKSHQAISAQEYRVSKDVIEEQMSWMKERDIKVPRRQKIILEQPYADTNDPRRFIMPRKYFTAPRKSSVRADHLRADLEVLETALRLEWAGWEIAEKRGWDWKKFFTDWKRSLEAKGSSEISVLEAFEPFKRLMQFQLDTHTGPMVEGRNEFFAMPRAAVLSRKPKGPVTKLRNKDGVVFDVDPKDLATQPQEAYLGSSHTDFSKQKRQFYIRYPSDRGEVTDVYVNGRWISVSRVWQAETEADRLSLVREFTQSEKDEAMFRRIDSEIVYMRWPAMKPANDPSYMQVVQDIIKDWGKAEKVIIVDARGNTGGNGRLAQTTLLKWFNLDSKPTKTSERPMTMSWKYSPISKALRVNQFQQIDPEVIRPDGWQSVVSDLFDKSTDRKKIAWRTKKISWNFDDHKFDPNTEKQNPIVLFLVDQRCASSCEGILAIAQEWSALGMFDSVLVAGSTTAGVSRFGDSQPIILPNTEVPFMISEILMNHFGDGRSYDGYGLKVDLLLDTKETQSAEYILNLARSLTRFR